MPLLIRGPGVATDSVDKLVTFPDFMPTFLELGGIAQPSYIDGRSLVPLLNGTASSWRTAVLLEERDLGFPERDYFGIRTADGVKYIEYASGFKEYYNLSTDPYEMANTPGSASASLVDRLQRLKTCAAATCRSIEDEVGGTPPPPPPPDDDTTSPTVLSTDPKAGATGVARSTNLTATFSEKMGPLSITKSTFKLFKVNLDGTQTQLTNVTVALSTDGLTATLNPFGTSTTQLARGTKYKGVITTGAKDAAGNQLDQDPNTAGLQQKTWTFTVSP